MASKIKIDDDRTTTLVINGSGRGWIITKGTTIDTSASDAISETGTRNSILLRGALDAQGSNLGIYSRGTDVEITIADGAIVHGGGAISSEGVNARITNRGELSADGDRTSMFSSGDGFVLHNYGDITSAHYSAVSSGGENAVIVNHKGASIVGPTGISLGSYVEDGATLTNHGLVKGEDIGIRGSSGNDTMINDGRVVGLVELAAGNDSFDTRGGRISGAVDGGAGNDVLITDNADYRLIESNGEGNDTVRSTVSYLLPHYVEKLILIGTANVNGKGTDDADTMTGNTGSNTLTSYAGTDILNGRGGNDSLWGGDDADRFIFGTGYDRDTIGDFEGGVDTIDLGGWSAIRNFSAVRSHAADHGDDLWIRDGSDILVISHMQKADLHSGDFSFPG